MTTTYSVVTTEAVAQQIVDFVEKDSGADDLTADSSLQSQGLDSLKVMSLVFKIEAHYDIVLDEEDADDLRTVGDLAALVVRRIERATMRGAPAIRPKHATLTEMLAEAARSEASLFFVNRKEQDQEVPMARVRERALSIAADLMARGVRKGDRVALVLPTCPEFVECLFGALCAGAIPVPLYPPVRLGKLERISL